MRQSLLEPAFSVNDDIARNGYASAEEVVPRQRPLQTWRRDGGCHEHRGASYGLRKRSSLSASMLQSTLTASPD